MELLKHNLESTGCIIYDSRCVSKYNTSYIVKNSRNEDVKFSSHIFAKNYNDAMNKIFETKIFRMMFLVFRSSTTNIELISMNVGDFVDVR